MTDEKNNINTENTGSEGADLSIYEIGYLLVPTIGEDDLGAETAVLRDVIEKSGFVVSETNPESIDLAYEMSKVVGSKRSRFNKAYFGSLIFQVPAADIAEVKNGIDKNNNIIRFLITKRDKGSLVPSKRRVVSAQDDSGAKSDDNEVKPEAKGIDKQELDKTIDALVE